MSPFDGAITDYSVSPASPGVATPVPTEPSLEGLLAFCESRPADEVYCWTGECLYKQYGVSLWPDMYPAGAYARVVRELKELLGDKSEGEPPGRIAYAHPRTFGAAASRIRSLLAGRASS